MDIQNVSVITLKLEQIHTVKKCLILANSVDPNQTAQRRSCLISDPSLHFLLGPIFLKNLSTLCKKLSALVTG